MNYSWPGNVRELNAAVEAACFRARYDRREFVCLEDIRLVECPVSRTHGAQDPKIMDTPEYLGSLFEQVEEFKRAAIMRALEKANGNQVAAARDLGVDRGTIRRLLRK
jgi:transcriptional regulator with GAF, ATPase, and Fis domain